MQNRSKSINLQYLKLELMNFIDTIIGDNKNIKITVISGRSKWGSMIGHFKKDSKPDALNFKEDKSGHEFRFKLIGMTNGLITTDNGQYGIELLSQQQYEIEIAKVSKY